jgi:hypothetical protein
MSLPDFKPQTRLFGIYGPAGLELDPADRYRLFAEKIYPLLVDARAELEECYCQDNGRPSVEPVLQLGVTLMAVCGEDSGSGSGRTVTVSFRMEVRLES